MPIYEVKNEYINNGTIILAHTIAKLNFITGWHYNRCLLKKPGHVVSPHRCKFFKAQSPKICHQLKYGRRIQEQRRKIAIPAYTATHPTPMSVT